jgi:hypothetical protein
VGASAGVCGMIAIFCAVHPMQEITTWLYFLPITIRALFSAGPGCVFSLRNHHSPEQRGPCRSPGRDYAGFSLRPIRAADFVRATQLGSRVG